MPNPHGNPEIKKHGFKTDRDEPLTERIAIRVTKTMAEKIKSIENYPEFCRRVLQEALDKLNQAEDQ
ncbi:hypothetical protein [Fischerella sp. JS2]|jgi:hypothetical protein|uniref:hypothetical protein n=1 Tax=Fischerella sp. JS2 TaxID=2597771 RepID=UPI0028E5CB6E|nr:hypothetical protein [Fischerella sp. JS2]